MSVILIFVITYYMARVNTNILGISELKWTGMAEFSSDEHYIYYCGQESLRRNGVFLIVNKRILKAVHGCNLKNRTISVHFQGKPFNITVHGPTTDFSLMLKNVKLTCCVKTYNTF